MVYILTSQFDLSAFFLAGVPLSTQWNKDGYFYGIQIAQFGLSHYSKNLTEKPAKIQVIKKAENGLPVSYFAI